MKTPTVTEERLELSLPKEADFECGAKAYAGPIAEEKRGQRRPAEGMRDRSRDTVSVSEGASPGRPLGKLIREAIEALESTRWKLTSPLAEWSSTDEGRNHAAVWAALEALREAEAPAPEVSS